MFFLSAWIGAPLRWRDFYRFEVLLSEVRPGDDIPVFTMSPAAAAPGGSVRIEGYGAPNSVQVALMSGGAGYVGVAARPGFGAWYLDPADPWLTAALRMPPVYVVLDSGGRFSASWNLPTAGVFGAGFGGELGWSFQVSACRRKVRSKVRIKIMG